MVLCTESEKKEMQGEQTGAGPGPGSHAGSELSLAGFLKTPSRAGRQFYHDVSRPRRACPILTQHLLHGLDTSWCCENCPHREGTPMNGCGRRWTTGRGALST